ncbi:MAG: hypothetical protein D6696_06150 [Acidobacteria bacterium]|nr:MAG: hypothetical protein D6696_06150 [Acidobacteriota bacterium]
MNKHATRCPSLQAGAVACLVVAALGLLWTAAPDAAGAVPLCDGGKVIWQGDEAVGCVFTRFGEAEKAMCKGAQVLSPTAELPGRCWVCVVKKYVPAIKDPRQWRLFTVGVKRSGAKRASFACLRPSLHNQQPYESIGEPTHYVRWTRWLNRDGPSGSGDFETLRDHRRESPREVCEKPINIECRVKGSGVVVKTGVLPDGVVFTCDKRVGGVCDNRKQKRGVRCRDYEVRFACAETLRRDP